MEYDRYLSRPGGVFGGRFRLAVPTPLYARCSTTSAISTLFVRRQRLQRGSHCEIMEMGNRWIGHRISKCGIFCRKRNRPCVSICGSCHKKRNSGIAITGQGMITLPAKGIAKNCLILENAAAVVFGSAIPKIRPWLQQINPSVSILVEPSTRSRVRAAEVPSRQRSSSIKRLTVSCLRSHTRMHRAAS
jgi:hypothetical protein